MCWRSVRLVCSHHNIFITDINFCLCVPGLLWTVSDPQQSFLSSGLLWQWGSEGHPWRTRWESQTQTQWWWGKEVRGKVEEEEYRRRLGGEGRKRRFEEGHKEVVRVTDTLYIQHQWRINYIKPTIHRHIPAQRTTWASSWTALCCWGWVGRTPICKASWGAGHLLSSRTDRRDRGTRWSSERGSHPPNCPR